VLRGWLRVKEKTDGRKKGKGKREASAYAHDDDNGRSG
jgi:hypothetical protein